MGRTQGPEGADAVMEEAGAAERGQEHQAFYLWEVPGKPISIEISYEAMDRMLLDALEGLGRVSRGRGVEAGGILLGTAEREGARRRIRIEDFRTVSCEHSFGPSYRLSERDEDELRRALEQWKRGPDRRLYAVGYWRSHTREELRLAAEDLEILSRYFAHPDQVALLIRPRGAGPGLAGFFFWEGGRIQSDAPYQTFPFEARLGRGPSAKSARDRAATAEARASEPAEDGPESPAPEARPPQQAPAEQPQFRFSMFEAPAPAPRRLRLWTILASLLLVLLAAGTVLLAAKGVIRLPQSPAPRDPFSVYLGGRDDGGNVHLTWDRTAPAIRGAERGVLVIADGDQTRTLELSRDQLRHGSVVYRRITDRVSFRLELLWGRRSLAESWSYEARPSGGASGAPEGGASRRPSP